MKKTLKSLLILISVLFTFGGKVEAIVYNEYSTTFDKTKHPCYDNGNYNNSADSDCTNIRSEKDLIDAFNDAINKAIIYLAGYVDDHSLSLSAIVSKIRADNYGGFGSGIHDSFITLGYNSFTFGCNNGYSITFTNIETKNGVCGNINGKYSPSEPAYSDLCYFGSPSAIEGSGPWKWTCFGTRGGSAVSCSATNSSSSSSSGGSTSSNPTTSSGGPTPPSPTPPSPILTYNWEYSTRSSCSNGCGATGTKTRTAIACKNSNGGTESDTTRCGPPQTSTTCTGDACPLPKKTGACSYYYYYVNNWNDCTYTGVSGNTIKCSQTCYRTLSNSTTKGSWYVTNKETGDVACSDSVNSYYYNNSYYGSSPRTSCHLGPVSKNLIIQSPTTEYPSNGTPYANNSDNLTLKINLGQSLDTNENRQVTGIPATSFTWLGSNVKSDITTGAGSDALNLKNSSVKVSVYPGQTLATLELTSVTPFDTNQGQIKFKLGGSDVTLNGVKLNFLKPFAGKIEVKNSTTGEWNGNINLGTLQQYRLQINNKDTKSILNNSTHVKGDITISDNNASNFVPKILEYSYEGYDYIKLNETKLSTGELLAELTYKPQDITHNIEFQTRVETKTGVTLPPKITDIVPGIQIKQATISYTLDDKFVKYYLSPEDGGIVKGDNMSPPPKVQITANNPAPITKTNPVEFLGVRVIGGIQGGGNSEFTGQKQNISSISSIEARTQIRKNAYTYINSMKSGDIVNGVKYVEGNVAISGDNLNYETLVVKNGNVIINGNLNTNNTKLLGIIVIKDGYNVTTDWKNSGNVYVTPGVQNINAIIYADGGLISIKSYDGSQVTLYDSDSIARTGDLNKQLYMNGSLFTRNTIGGAVLTNQTDGKYTLPGGAKTEYFNIALQYDLNYMRRGKALCENAGGLKQEQPIKICNYDEPFIIKYDPRVQTTPPKLFGN